MVREFCGARIEVKKLVTTASSFNNFVEFLVFFHICKKLKRCVLTSNEVIHGINSLRFGQKARCIIQHICSNKHHHLL